jgi:opacity protein-like surface antigen
MRLFLIKIGISLFFLFGFQFPDVQILNAQQGTIYAVKGGLTAGTQRWNNYNRSTLMKYHLAASIESWDIENRNALMMQLGYHVKGSALRSRRTINPITGNEIPGRRDEFQFHNISLMLGAKQKMEVFTESKLYYLIGLRGDYNLKYKINNNRTNFEREISESLKDQINKFTFGLTVGGGIEIPLSYYTGLFFELTVAPDFTNQIYIPPQRSFYNPAQLLQEQKVLNVAIELSVGMRFLHEVIYTN